MTEEEVKGLFVTIGQVQSCKVIKDKLNQISLGYAFVNYYKSEDAKKAIDSLNGLPVQNKNIKVSYARPSSTTIKNANLYIAHLPKTYTQDELVGLFSPYGNIITSKILVDNTTGLSRGVGFVRYDKHSEAESAISSLNGKIVHPSMTQPLMVKFANQAKPSSIQPMAPTAAAASNHINTIAALSRRAHPVFNPAGAGGPMRHALATNLRFNPVSVATPQALTMATLTGMTQAVSTPSPYCIFVYNLPENTTDSLLYQLFGPFGAVGSVKVIMDNATKKCKRYGFVNMMNYDEACVAVAALNGVEIEGRALQVSFKSAKDDRAR